MARTLLTERLQAKQEEFERYAPVFDRAVVLNAKSLIVLMTLPFALLLPLMFLGARRPFMLHVVFALHLYTFLLLLFSLALLAAKFSEWAGGGGIESPLVDNVLSITIFLACTAYLYRAIGSVYGGNKVILAVKSLSLAIAVGAIALGYRFVLFLLTLYGT